MKMLLTPREQRLLLFGGGLAVVVLWTYTTYILQPLMREAAALGQDVTKARDELRTLEVATANETALREQHRQLNETVMSLQRLLPPEKELPAVIELLSDLASQSDVKIQTIFPQRPAPPSAEDLKELAQAPAEPVVYKDVVIQIDATAGFHQLGTFLSLVEAQHNPTQLATLKISSDPKLLKRQRIKLLIRSYFSVGELAAARTAPAAAAPGPGR
ncbi:MAG: type 4a pilus biogenesis protein PilO [Candidatus Omnitrophica bacterium]|nr:type 4a pilus biogenesis protein PilO [Candidatus Omnitrophota bacterium]